MSNPMNPPTVVLEYVGINLGGTPSGYNPASQPPNVSAMAYTSFPKTLITGFPASRFNLWAVDKSTFTQASGAPNRWVLDTDVFIKLNGVRIVTPDANGVYTINQGEVFTSLPK